MSFRGLQENLPVRPRRFLRPTCRYHPEDADLELVLFHSQVITPADSKIATSSCGVTRFQPLSFDAQRSACGSRAHEVSSRNSNTKCGSAGSQRLELSSMLILPISSISTAISHSPIGSP